MVRFAMPAAMPYRFDDARRAIVITQPRLPQPWTNYLSNGTLHAFVSQAGGGFAVVEVAPEEPPHALPAVQPAGRFARFLRLPAEGPKKLGKLNLGLWEQGVRVCSCADPPPEPVLEPWLDDPFPACHGVAERRRACPGAAQRRRDDDTEPAMEYAGD